MILQFVDESRLPEVIPTEVPVGILSKLRFAIGAQRGAEGWSLYLSSILPHNYSDEILFEPLCQLLSGAAREEDSFGGRLDCSGKDTSDVVSEFNLSALQLPNFGSKGIVVFTAEVFVSVHGDLISLWARNDEDFRFIPLPDLTSVTMQGDLHALISAFCRAESKSNLTHWLWLERSRPPIRRMPEDEDWVVKRRETGKLGVLQRMRLEIEKSLF